MNTFNRIARTVSEPFEVPYTYLVLLVVCTIGFWLGEWLINLAGGGAFNTFATIITSIIILVVGMKPLYVAYSGQIGVLASVLLWRDPRFTIAKAITIQWKVVLWLIFANILVGLMLGNIPFGAPFGNTVMVFPNLMLLVTAAILFGYLFDMNGVDLKKKVIAGFLILVLGVLAWNWVGPEARDGIAGQFKSAKESVSGVALDTVGGADCADTVPVVEHGARLTVRIDCPVTVDQRRMAKGMDFVLVDPVLRAQTGNQQLVSFDQKPGSHQVTLLANVEGFKRVGRSAIEVELYNKGTGAEAVAKRHGIYIAPDAIDLRPAP